MSDEQQVVYSDPAVTLKAKDFLENGLQSDEYKAAANSAVLEVVSAINLRIEKNLRNFTAINANKRRATSSFIERWLRR